MMSVLNLNIMYMMIDGVVYKLEVESKNIMVVLIVYLNGEFFGSGCMMFEEIFVKMGSGVDVFEFVDKELFDVFVVGGGFVGVSVVIYIVCKGICIGVVVECFGGQVFDIMSIENFISVKVMEGLKFVVSFEEYVKEYDIDVMNFQCVKCFEKKDLFEFEFENGVVLKSKIVILLIGVCWCNVNVSGE